MGHQQAWTGGIGHCDVNSCTGNMALGHKVGKSSILPHSALGHRIMIRLINKWALGTGDGRPWQEYENYTVARGASTRHPFPFPLRLV